MSQRLSYGAIAIATVLLVVSADALCSDSWTQFGSWIGPLARRGSVIPLLFTALMILGAEEFLRMLRSVGSRPHGLWAKWMVFALMLTPWFYSAYAPAGYQVSVEGMSLQLLWIVIALVGAIVIQMYRGLGAGAMNDIGATVLTAVYCGLLPSFVVVLRVDSTLPVSQGAWIILIFLAITKASDIGAFFIGSAFGRHKLIPSVSPGKSVEGMFGGLASSAVVGVLLWYLNYWLTHAPTSVGHGVNEGYAALVEDVVAVFAFLSLPQVLLFSVVISAAGQLGDLLESAIKRAASAKDSAQLIPEFGGVLDLVDSPILAAPVAWILLTLVWGVV
jgi:phosphatidate cytidylyltransferase